MTVNQRAAHYFKQEKETACRL